MKKRKTQSNLKTAEKIFEQFLNLTMKKSLNECDAENDEMSDVTLLTESEVSPDLFDKLGEYLYEIKYSTVSNGEVIPWDTEELCFGHFFAILLRGVCDFER